jgi:hypothetical protein
MVAESRKLDGTSLITFAVLEPRTNVTEMVEIDPLRECST